ncbi:MAG TPA: MMPL family transporter [Actinophytocola sp.]|uniref:MMPL family transporter n=1 Tax=Actinophytocola sp. TaxID=1872138 RepID=UPI002F95B289
MFSWWGMAMSRLRWLVVLATIGFVAFAGVWGTGVFDRLADDASLSDPSSESAQISDRVTKELGAQKTHFVALYSSDYLTVSDPAFAAEIAAVTKRVRGFAAVKQVTSFYETKAPQLVSRDKHATYLPIRFATGTDDATVAQVRDALAVDTLKLQVGGPLAIDEDISGQVEHDIVRAELIAMPILLVLLVLIFGSLVAACMPLVLGVLAILGAFTAVRGITMLTDVSVFSINIITILGLGLAVDYALFMVTRFREELDRGRPVRAAVSRTMATAGRTVAVSGTIVSLSLSGLLMFPQLLLRSMGLGGAAAVAVAMVSSLTVLPALLALLGHRIDALRLPWSRRRRIRTVTGAVESLATRSGGWARIARSVMRRPVLYTIGITAVLLVLATPFTRVQFGGVDERVLPAGTESRVVSERLDAEFPGGGSDPIKVLVSDVDPGVAKWYTGELRMLGGVTGVEIAAQRGRASLLNVEFAGAANSEHARQIVEEIRAADPPAGAEVLVGGPTAGIVDQLNRLDERLPWMALLVAGVTFVLLTFAFGSIVVPLKAIVMNLVSIGAAFGVVVWIFQDGHLADFLGFTPTGYIDASQPILMLAILFGLSMDYEVFLLSRIREQWDHLGDNTSAVAAGVQRTGGIITAAALLLCVVVGAFATSGITFIKMVGVGMLVALAVDATLVRLLLVPATMRLLGRGNWWAPSFLRGIYGRYGGLESELDDFLPAEREHVLVTAR